VSCRLVSWVCGYSLHAFCQLIRSPSVLDISWVIGLDMLCCARVTILSLCDDMIPNEGIIARPNG
jgi:hypothetical protein